MKHPELVGKTGTNAEIKAANLRKRSDAELVEVETFTPEELGWVRIGPRQWEKPNGERYIFPPGGPELIQRIKGVV